jgi:hypothetical protein
MELGQPDEVIKPQRSNWGLAGDSERQQARVKRGLKTRIPEYEPLSLAQYRREHKKGKTDAAISDKYGIKLETLRAYKVKWRKQYPSLVPDGRSNK